MTESCKGPIEVGISTSYKKIPSLEKVSMFSWTTHTFRVLYLETAIVKKNEAILVLFGLQGLPLLVWFCVQKQGRHRGIMSWI